LKDLRRILYRLGLESRRVDAVEVAAKLKGLPAPKAPQHPDKLLRAAVPLVVFEPRLAKAGELLFKPTAHDVDRKPPAAELVDGRPRFGQHRRMPKPRMHGGDEFDPLGQGQEPRHRRDRLQLVIRPVAGKVAGLHQAVIKPGFLGLQSQPPVVLKRPVRLLRDLGNDQPPLTLGTQ